MKNAAHKTLGATEFKATCLSLLDEVKSRRTRVTITKRGEAFAYLVPVDRDEGAAEDPLSYFHIGGRILGDVTKPVAALEDYEALR